MNLPLLPTDEPSLRAPSLRAHILRDSPSLRAQGRETTKARQSLRFPYFARRR